MSISYKRIGTIRSPFKSVEGVPIQPVGAEGVRGEVVVDPPYQAGLEGLEGFSHVVLVYHFHASEGYELRVRPFLDSTPRGVFATRSPRRPNPIGISVVKLVDVRENVVYVENLDVLDGTPLLDLKPHVPQAAAPGPVKLGWLERRVNGMKSARADLRFKDWS
ncbi:MAG: tRNA (N6-threonylcarbamoyladenosine(37)-N6)-methyltransferase TrmO [Promethearchaeota archaeon]